MLLDVLQHTGQPPPAPRQRAIWPQTSVVPQLEDTLEDVDMLVKMQIDARWAEPDGPGVGLDVPLRQDLVGR